LNITDRLQELALLRQLALERFNAGEFRRLQVLFTNIADEIKEILRGPALTELKGQRLERQIAELTAMVSVTMPMQPQLAEVEAQWAATSLASVGVDAVLPPTDRIAAIASASLVQGAPLGKWLEQLDRQIRFDIERVVRIGVTLGQTNREIAKAIIGVKANGDKGPEPLKKARRDAMALARTATQTIANDAILATYDENRDVLRGLEYVATLDSRTTPQCAALDGAVWNMDRQHIAGPKLPFAKPPIHFQCRSRLVPVTKSFRDLGIDLDDIPPGERASAYGPVSSTLKFEEFAELQGAAWTAEWLGQTRYQLYKEKKLTLSQLIDPRTLRPLTIAQLREL
jgi:SPP1 gp7 family putative phage head morphogenesis protein